MSLKPFLKRLIEDRAVFSRHEARELMETVFSGASSELELAALLGAIAARGETAPEVAGFVDAMRAAATPLLLTNVERTALVDTCGTGGDLSGTFNISTAAALVAAAAGAKVAKHGNRAVTSKSGSADVLEALGIPIDLSPDAAAESIRTHGFAYLHAPAMHSSVKAVAPVRRALGVRTVFNVLGPLTNPAGASAQVMGVYAADRVHLVAETMLLLGTRHAFVVHGFTDSAQTRGMDELSISGPSLIAEVRDGGITRTSITPEDLNFERSPIAMLRGGDAQANAAILESVFAGKPGPARDVVVLNAAAVLVTANRAADLAAGVLLARQTIDSGFVLRLVETLSGRA
jgi:anthranilate phosphoribosyltransferase